MSSIDDFKLREITPGDKDLILSWRNLDRVRCNMYTDHIISQEEHERWFSKALTDDTSKSLIFEYLSRPVGFVSFTALSTLHDRCSWAFYLGETDVPRTTGPAMEFFALSYAFEVLQIRKLCCEVFTFNAGVIKLHEKFGFVREGHFSQHYLKNGTFEDIVCLAKFKESWGCEKDELKRRCFGKGA